MWTRTRASRGLAPGRTPVVTCGHGTSGLTLCAREWACGAAGSATAWHAVGQGFESPQVHHNRGNTYHLTPHLSRIRAFRLSRDERLGSLKGAESVAARRAWSGNSHTESVFRAHVQSADVIRYPAHRQGGGLLDIQPPKADNDLYSTREVGDAARLPQRAGG